MKQAIRRRLDNVEELDCIEAKEATRTTIIVISEELYPIPKVVDPILLNKIIDEGEVELSAFNLSIDFNILSLRINTVCYAPLQVSA